jgi:hypothetical protein
MRELGHEHGGPEYMNRWRLHENVMDSTNQTTTEQISEIQEYITTKRASIDKLAMDELGFDLS